MSSPRRGKSDDYSPGDWNATCFECGRKFKASQLYRHWQGYYVCPEHWEPRQPQDLVRGVQDIVQPAAVQPPTADTFAQTSFIITESSDEVVGPLIYITTEDNNPLETET